MRFFLHASKEEKIKRLISQGNTAASAVALVERVDHERSDFIKNYFHAEWPDRSLYHAMVNTDIGDDTLMQAMLSFLGKVTESHHYA